MLCECKTCNKVEKIIDLTPFDIAVDADNLMPEEVAMAVYRM